MRKALTNLEAIREELKTTKNRIATQSAHEVEVNDLNRALRLIDTIIVSVVDYIEFDRKREEEKEKDKE